MFLVIMVLLCVFGTCAGMKSEQSCSKFHYEEKTLEKLIRLQFFVENMKEDMDNTRKNVANEVAEMKTQRDDMDMELKGIANTITSELASMKQLITDRLSSFEQDIQNMKDSMVTPPVIFHSKSPSDLTLATNKVIAFTTVTDNYNGAYDSKTGMFTAPIAGLYQFNIQLCTSSNQYIEIGIFKNDEVYTTSGIGDIDWTVCYTINALIKVQSADRISVRCVAGCDKSLYEHANRQNTFSGVIIQMT